MKPARSLSASLVKYRIYSSRWDCLSGSELLMEKSVRKAFVGHSQRVRAVGFVGFQEIKYRSKRECKEDGD